ncbi:MAG: hypothetical protein WKF78_03465 [Candidatus Limnocylindrales bacterium]
MAAALAACPWVRRRRGRDPALRRLAGALSALIALQAPRGCTTLGIDEGTAVVGRDGAWQVHGRARVTVWRGRRRERFGPGDIFRI